MGWVVARSSGLNFRKRGARECRLNHEYRPLAETAAHISMKVAMLRTGISTAAERVPAELEKFQCCV